MDRSPIQVAFVHAHLGLGGAEVLRVEVLAHLRERGILPRVYLLEDRNDFRDQLEALHIPTTTLARSASLYRLDTLAALARRLRQARPDVVHASQFASAFHARLASTLAARRAVLVTEEHGFSRWRRPWHDRLDRLLVRRTDAVIAVSEAVRRHCLARGLPADRVVTLLNPCRSLETTPRGAELRRSLGLTSDAWVIGTVGTLRWEKAHDVLLEAFARISPQLPEARLWIAGDGPLRAQLQQHTARLGLTERVTFLGARRDVADLLSNLDAFAFPSRSEGLGLALLEAMASEVPVVASRCGGIPEIVDHERTGLLVPPDDPVALADALLRLQRAPAQAEALAGAAARYVAEEHSPQTYADRLVDLYRTLLAERGRRRLSLVGKA